MYKLLYVDEQENDRREFQRAFHESFVVEPLEPEGEIDKFVGTVLENKFDGLVSDYKLQEHSNVNWNGAALIERVRNIKEGFPCFILTSYPDGDGDVAIESVDDANIVYDKKLYHDRERLDFLKNAIDKNIRNYQLRIKDAEERIHNLIQKDQLSLHEQEELFELDNMLERAINKESSIPAILKQQLISGKIDDLLKLTAEVIDQNN